MRAPSKLPPKNCSSWNPIHEKRGSIALWPTEILRIAQDHNIFGCMLLLHIVGGASISAADGYFDCANARGGSVVADPRDELVPKGQPGKWKDCEHGYDDHGGADRGAAMNPPERPQVIHENK